jgi:DNA invertase Pin-like site-specific DNA recombinase
MRLLGYARVSTADQDLAAQRQALLAAGCTEIREEKASGANRARPELARLLAAIGPADTLVVVRIDRLARSLAHLLEVIARLEAKGAKFRSLGDPIDTAAPSGTLILQILGAVAEFERALIRERTMAGLTAARAQGRVGGNPGLRGKEPSTVARLAARRQAAASAREIPQARALAPLILAMRPAAPWKVVAAVSSAELSGQDRANGMRKNEQAEPAEAPLTPSRLRRLAQSLVGQGLLPSVVMAPAARVPRVDGAARRATEMAAAYLRGRPDATLSELGRQMLRLGVKPPRGGASWAASSLKLLRDRARTMAGASQSA